MSTTEKHQLLRQMASARTTEEIAAAKRAQQAWLREHPDDLEVRLSGEQLEMAQAALGIMEARKAPRGRTQRRGA